MARFASMTIQLSLHDARRIVLAAQGFGKRRAGQGASAHLHRALDRLGVVQIDSVNVLARAHYLPAYSRIGGHDLGELEQAASGEKRNRRMFEYWAHEASLLPLDLHPLFRWRMARAERGEIGYSALRRFATVHRQKAQSVLARIAAEGPLAASDFEGGAGKGGWWAWAVFLRHFNAHPESCQVVGFVPLPLAGALAHVPAQLELVQALPLAAGQAQSLLG